MIIPTLSSKRLVGRTAELQSLHDARRALSSGRGCVMLVGGEAGIGKTRLLAEFTAVLGGGRAPYYAVGECLADAPRPFGPFRAVISKLLALAPASFENATPLIRHTLAAMVPDALEALGIAFVVPAVLEKTELFTGVLRFLAALAAKRATVIALEDLHWADSATLELLVHVASRIGGLRVLLIATYRDDDLHSEHPLFASLARLEREQNVRRIALEPLADPEIQALIHEALGKSYSLEPGQIKDVIARAEGNPFFTEELVKKLLQGPLQTAGTLPISIRAMILERLVLMSRDERDVLDHAAVLGAQFDVKTLAIVMDRHARDVLPALRRMRDLNLVVEETAPPGRFRFRHALTRQTIYDDLLSVDTRSLHEHIVRRLEALAAADAPIDVEPAYHSWKAGLQEPTLRYNELAGDAALAVCAAVEAATYYERALSIAADDEARIRLLGKAGEAYVNQSAFDNATAACMAQHALLLARGDYDAACLALTRAAGEFANGGQVQKAVSIIEGFLEQHAGRLTAMSSDHMYASLARMATACDDYDRARTALAAVRNPHALPAFSHQVYWLAQLFVAQNQLDPIAWKSAVAALRARNPDTYPLMQSQMLHSIASTSIDFADLAEGETAIDEAIAIDRELGFTRALAFASAVKACILCVQGRLNEARAFIEAGLAEPDMFVVRLELAVGASAAAIASGDDELARRCLDDEVFRRVREAGMSGLLPLMSGMEAARLYAAGHREQAAQMLNEALEGTQHQFAVIHFWPFAARHSGEQGLVRLRSLCAQRTCNPNDRAALACAALVDAVAAWRSGANDATDLASVAADRYRALGWPLHEASALEVGGQTDAALSLYRSCGSVADVRRLEMPGPAAAARNLGRGGLSPREREVAALVSRGFTNRAIADTLSVSEKTVEKYVSAIYVKLSFSTRSQLAAYVARSEGT